MTSKHWKIVAGLAAATVLVSLSFSGGLALGFVIPRLTAPETLNLPPALPVPRTDREELMAPFWEAWDVVHDDFFDQPLDDEELVRGAIRGMMDALGDPDSSYMDPDEYLQANLPLEGEYEGIGAWVDSDGQLLTIISAMPDSPAERAGLLPGDQVVGVDGEDVREMDANLVIRKVLGPAGTNVTLEILREGLGETFTVDITRQTIELRSVEFEMLEDDVAYIQLMNFGAQTSRDLDRALEELMERSPRALILDLRGNGGGFLNTAIDVASQFIDEGVVMIERFGDGRETVYESDGNGRATGIEMVVLINGGSASASEIVAGAIQDHERGTLIGETSFGKGSVQNWSELRDDQGAIRVTIARWYTPGDRLIHGTGLTPDVEVLSPQEQSVDQDVQLEKALELLIGETARLP